MYKTNCFKKRLKMESWWCRYFAYWSQRSGRFCVGLLEPCGRKMNQMAFGLESTAESSEQCLELLTGVEELYSMI